MWLVALLFLSEMDQRNEVGEEKEGKESVFRLQVFQAREKPIHLS